MKNGSRKPSALTAKPGFARREPHHASGEENLKEGARGGTMGSPTLIRILPGASVVPALGRSQR